MGADLPEALATGEAGTVYLCHPFLVYAAQRHEGTPRFLANPRSIRPNPSGSIDKKRLFPGRNHYSPGFAERPQQLGIMPSPPGRLTLDLSGGTMKAMSASRTVCCIGPRVLGDFGRRQPVSQAEPDPHGQEQHGERDHGIHQR
jgi:hypothetical protein